VSSSYECTWIDSPNLFVLVESSPIVVSSGKWLLMWFMLLFQEFAHPSYAVMREKLKQYSWSSTSDSSSVIRSTILDDGDAVRSDTGLTGLCNLGNTCYINSVLQVLYMCDRYWLPYVSIVIVAYIQNVFAVEERLRLLMIFDLQTIFLVFPIFWTSYF